MLIMDGREERYGGEVLLSTMATALERIVVQS